MKIPLYHTSDSAISHNHSLLAEGSSKAPGRFLLLKEGDIEWAGLEGVELSKGIANSIIANFEEHGSKIPIDYHHASEKVRTGKIAKAPAAGFIGGLEYVEGEGLFATDIEWTAEGKDDVESKRFIYTSPAVFAPMDDDGERIIKRITSVALTNQPRTIDAKELMLVADMIQNGEFLMTKYEKLKKRLAKVPSIIMAQEVDDDGVPQFPAIDAAQKAIADLMEVLKGKGMDVPSDAPLESVIASAIEALGATEPADEHLDDDKKKDDEEETVAAENVMKSDTIKNLSTQVGELTKRLEAKELAETNVRLDAMIANLVAENKINPNDEKAMKNARIFAEKDEEACANFFDSLPAYAPAKATTASGGKGSGTSRQKKVKSLMAEWAEGELAPMCSQQEYVNGQLTQDGDKILADSEFEALV